MLDDPVPIIDISGTRGTPREKYRIAKEIDQACREIGFLVIAGHGVPEPVVARADAAAHAYFDLPASAKLGHIPARADSFRGYHAYEASPAALRFDDRKAPADLFERFAIGPVDTDAADPYFAASAAARDAYAPNAWPHEVPDFGPAMCGYWHAMAELSQTLMRLFAIGLGLDEYGFDDKFDKPMSALVAQNYPDQTAPPGPNQWRRGAHTDPGCLTILKTENKPGGLEVRTQDGAWWPVYAIPGTFIVNLGDLMARWTNDRWISAEHRVANPPRAQARNSRLQSLIYFHQPNYDAVIECLPTCRGERPAKYPPITSAEQHYHIAARPLAV